jgi:ABC-type antimicrobial peptide transport system ATPase subunit
VLLLDEPAAGLDAEAHRTFFDDLESVLADRATTVVQVTHRADEALRLADRIAVLVDGAMRQLGDPASVLRRPSDPTVATLLGYENVLAVEVNREGQVLMSGVRCRITTTLEAGPATLALGRRAPAHAAGCRAPPGDRRARRPRPGRWELTLTGPQTMHAHMPLDQTPPRLGESVGVELDPAHVSMIAGEPRVTGTRA